MSHREIGVSVETDQPFTEKKHRSIGQVEMHAAKNPVILTCWILGQFILTSSTDMPQMDVLLVAATALETTYLRGQLGLAEPRVGAVQSFDFQGIDGGLLHTGIGMVNTALQLGRHLESLRPLLAVQFGIAGAFPGGPALKEVVEVVEDCYAELGADSPEGFLPLAELGFPAFERDGQAYYNALHQPQPAIPGLRACKAVTVNRVSGEANRIAELQQIWNPEVETMEGAAFFQACLMAGIPFRAFRAISNLVEPRNRAAWLVLEAVQAAQTHMMGFLSALATLKK